MIHSSGRDRKTKAIAEVLAMIADAHPELAAHHPRAVCETDELLWESAIEFCAALDRYAESTAPVRANAPRAASLPARQSFAISNHRPAGISSPAIEGGPD